GMTRLHTPVCDLLGIEIPIFQGGMATYTSAELVAAVSNAGGLGIIGALGRNRDDLRDEIRRVRNLTSKPFGVNHVVCRIDAACVELTLAPRVPVISLSCGRADELTARAHEAGLKVVRQDTTPEAAASKVDDDILGILWPGSVVRAIKNPILDEWARKPDEWAKEADALRPALQAAVNHGDFVLAGESVGLIHEILPAAELVKRIVAEAEALLGGYPARTPSP